MTSEQTESLSRAFERSLCQLVPDVPDPGLIGLEHEYRLLQSDGRQVDFRSLIHELSIPGRRLDPGDANAYRLRSGLALTCDDAEGEIATPPVSLRRGFSVDLRDRAEAGERELRALLPAGIAMAGFSTHLNVSLPDSLGLAVMGYFSSTFAPMLMLLLHAPESRGIYVRPRPGRLEVCGELVRGQRLQAAAVFVAGAVRATITAARGEAVLQAAECPVLDVTASPAHGRFGSFVGRRRAFGFDLADAGRDTPLPLADGGRLSLQEYIERAWAAARAAIRQDCDPAEAALVDEFVSNQPHWLSEERPHLRTSTGHAQPMPSPFGAILDLRPAGEVSLQAVAATWDFSIVRFERGGRRAFACIPRDYLPALVDTASRAELAGVLSSYLDTADSGRRLDRHEDALTPGLWDEVTPGKLVPAERGADGSYDVTIPGKGRKPSGKRRARIGKTIFAKPPVPAAPPVPVPPPRRESEPPPSPAPQVPWRPLAAAAAVIVGIVLGAVAAAGGLSPGGAPVPSATPTASATASATPTATRTPLPPSETAAPASPTAQPPTSAPAGAATSTPRPATEPPVPPSSTPVVDVTATASATPGSAASSTPTPTRTFEATRTATASPTPTPCDGALCTPTPTRTPIAPAQ